MRTKLRASRSLFIATLVFCTAVWGAWTTFALANGPASWAGWQVGEPAEQPLALSTPESAAINAWTVRLLSTLGIRPSSIEISRSFDRLRQQEVDSITGLDAARKPIVSIDRDTESGSLRTLTRYVRDLAPSGSELGQEDVPGSALAYLQKAGVTAPSAPPRVTWDPGMQSWEALWTRQIGGVVAPEDFLSVWVLGDGELRALSDLASQAAPAPKSPIASSDAETRVRLLLGVTAGIRSVTLGEPRLEWLHPNDFVSPALPDSPDPILRLVYVVPYSIVLSTRDTAEGMLWVDAGTGELVGGGAIS